MHGLRILLNGPLKSSFCKYSQRAHTFAYSVEILWDSLLRYSIWRHLVVILEIWQRIHTLSYSNTSMYYVSEYLIPFWIFKNRSFDLCDDKLFTKAPLFFICNIFKLSICRLRLVEQHSPQFMFLLFSIYLLFFVCCSLRT